MTSRLQAASCLVLCALVAGLGALGVHRSAPWPAADTSRGSEEAFLSGAYERELTREGPRRRVAPLARVRFEHLPPGPSRLELVYRNAPTPVTIVVNGARLATWRAGSRSGSFELPPSAGRVLVELDGAGREMGGRRMGPLFVSALLRHAPARWPSAGLVLIFVLPAVCAALAGLAARLAPGVACAAAAAVTLVQCAALWPYGLVRSPYALSLALLLGCGALGVSVCARLLSAGEARVARWAFVALLAAFFVQGVAAVAPLMEVSDAVFHANKLEDVAHGDLFPQSVTQHARPFRFPYGVSFYALLAPLARAGLDRVLLVRWGAALASLAASAVLFALLRAAPSRAALAVVLLQALPATFEVFSFGNLSNVFGQALSVAFFAWWTSRAPGGALVGASLLALGCLAHFSSLIVLTVLVVALVALDRRAAREPAPGGARDVRLRAALLGLGAAAAYYACFAELLFGQLPRLLEGGGQGSRADFVAQLGDQARWALARLGWPALALGVLGLRSAGPERLARGLRAFWWTGVVLLALALVSPLEVRYLYALTLPLAVAAADGARRWAARGALARVAVALLLAVQAGLALRDLLEAVLLRYRP